MKKVWGTALCMLALCGLIGCAKEKKETLGLFSWSDSAVEDSQELFDTAKKVGITEIYQHFSKDMSQEKITDFLEEAEKKELDIYYLTGEPHQGLQPEAEELLEEIHRCSSFNRQSRGMFCGVMVDVEPYLTEEWEEDQEEVMDTYVDSMDRVYGEAKRQKLRCILCVPYFYDKKGFSDQLETLIRDCCDGIAVMNYQKENEWEQISFEAETAKTYDKKVMHIYELQKAGKHELTERNTYYQDGLEAVEESRQGLREHFPDMAFAYHDYKSLKELLEDE